MVALHPPLCYHKFSSLGSTVFAGKVIVLEALPSFLSNGSTKHQPGRGQVNRMHCEGRAERPEIDDSESVNRQQ
jgi:hypothetical protein